VKPYEGKYQYDFPQLSNCILMKKEYEHFLLFSKLENFENHSEDFQLNIIEITKIPKFDEF